MKVKINLIMGNRMCGGQESRQMSSSKKYNEKGNGENVLEERNAEIDCGMSGRFLKHLTNRGGLDDLDSIFMVP